MTNPDYQAVRMLIVDDISHARILLRGVLLRLGVRDIAEAGGVEEAFAHICQFPCDVVITDWEMPGGSGIDLVRAIRTDPRAPDPTIPIILLTAHGSLVQVQQGRDAGTTDFLVKPFTSASIAQRLQSVINCKRAMIITPTYRGPDRRRTDRPVVVERRAGAPASDVSLIPPDGLLQARVSGDPAAIAEAKKRHRATVEHIRREAVASPSSTSPRDMLAGLVSQAIDRPERWPNLAVPMRQPLDASLRGLRGTLTPRLTRVADLFQVFVGTPARGGQEPELLRRLLLAMRAILMIGDAADAEAIALGLADEIDALHAQSLAR